MIQDADENTFAGLVLQPSSGAVLVEFWGTNCGHCRTIEPFVQDIAKRYDGRVRVVKVNIDNNPAFRDAYQLMGVPYLFMFVDGQVADSLVGAHPKAAIEALVEKHAPAMAQQQQAQAGMGGVQQPPPPPVPIAIRPRGWHHR